MLEERLLKLLDTEQLSSSKFADVIGVQRSSVSHILSGRNKPSFDFLQKTLKAFPYLNADWLILGEGKMYDTEEFTGGGSLFDQNLPGGSGSAEPDRADSGDAVSTSESERELNPGNVPGAQRDVDRDSDSTPSAQSDQASRAGTGSASFTGIAGDPRLEDSGGKALAENPEVKGEPGTESIPPSSPVVDKASKKIARILVLYADNSFDSFEQD